jgi:serine/threonine-protein kinase
VPDQTEQFDRLKAALADRYRIERQLGVGGMATVHLAHDVKHDRKVAIKVLKPELAAMLGAERFVQEIRTTANLQHPHILPLFDSGEADRFLYYVMPYIKGETLRDKLNRETQLGIEEAVKIATDVADALNYAHRQNVIHRDIKPENILLHDGRPMVADFGIALAVSAAAGGRMTETGLSLGTPHYMSPEQATAEKDLTKRSDIYSLGAVLYEMLTGNPPHVGSSAQQIIMRIVTEEPAPVTNTRKAVPPNVAAAVAKALEKLPADRFESAVNLAEALRNPAFTFPTTRAAGEASGFPTGPWNRLTVGATAVAALLAVGALWGWLRTPAVDSAYPDLRVLVDFAEDRAPIFQPGGALALSPDGMRLAYTGGGGRVSGANVGRIWIRPLDRLSADSVPASERAHSPFWSPGGDSIGFIVDNELRIFSTRLGGGVTTVGRSGKFWYGASWSKRGEIAVGTERGIEIFRVSDGSRRTLTEIAGSNELHHWPYWVPGQDAVTFTIWNLDAQQGTVAVARLDDGARIDTLVKEGFNGRVLPSGDLLWADAAGTARTARFDAEGRRLEGGSSQLLAGVQVAPGLEFRLSMSQQGAVIYGPAAAVKALTQLVVVDRATGNRIQLPTPPDARLMADLRLAPDGSRLAFSGIHAVNQEIWLYEFATSEVEQFTLGGINLSLAWTPDADRLVYRTTGDLVWRPIDRSSPAERIGPRVAEPASFAPDGRTLLLQGGATQFDVELTALWTLELPDSIPRRITESDDALEFNPAVSPNGLWLAYTSNRSGTVEVWVRSFRGTAGPWQVSRGGGYEPVWRRDGRELFFRTDSAIMAVDVAPGAVFDAGVPYTVVAAGSSVSPIQRQSFDVFPDGNRFVLFESRSGAGVDHLVLETNLLGRGSERN